MLEFVAGCLGVVPTEMGLSALKVPLRAPRRDEFLEIGQRDLYGDQIQGDLPGLLVIEVLLGDSAVVRDPGDAAYGFTRAW